LPRGRDPGAASGNYANDDMLATIGNSAPTTTTATAPVILIGIRCRPGPGALRTPVPDIPTPPPKRRARVRGGILSPTRPMLHSRIERRNRRSRCTRRMSHAVSPPRQSGRGVPVGWVTATPRDWRAAGQGHAAGRPGGHADAGRGVTYRRSGLGPRARSRWGRPIGVPSQRRNASGSPVPGNHACATGPASVCVACPARSVTGRRLLVADRRVFRRSVLRGGEDAGFRPRSPAISGAPVVWRVSRGRRAATRTPLLDPTRRPGGLQLIATTGCTRARCSSAGSIITTMSARAVGW